MAEHEDERRRGWLRRHAHPPTKAVLAASAAVAACAMIGVLLGAYLHEVRTDVPNSATQVVPATSVSTTVSTVVVTVEPDRKQIPSDVADRKPLRRAPRPTPKDTSPPPTKEWTATPLPQTTKASPSCTGVLGCLLRGPDRLPDPRGQ